MVTDEERQLMLRAYARDNERCGSISASVDGLLLLGNDRRKIELLNVPLFSLPGTPVLYYGDEIEGRQRVPRRTATASARRCSGPPTATVASPRRTRTGCTCR
ncbi:MAG: hypothetical protein R2697_21565 [Ilumatobacteraceae bacterium]